MISSIQIAGQEADEFWEIAEPFIKQALDKTNITHFSTDHVLEKIKEDHLALFVILDSENTKDALGAYTVSIIEHPLEKIATIVHLGAENLDDAVACYPKMVAYAKENGADKLNIYGRRGWEPTVRKLGFKPILVCFEQDVPHG